MRRSMVLGGGCALMLLCAGQAMGGLSFRTVALTGTDGAYGPGLGSGVTFTWVGPASLNASGQAAFSGSTLVGAFNGDGAWLRPDATSTSNNLKLYMNGDTRPGSAPSGPFAAATFPSGSPGYQSLGINNAGQTMARQATTGVIGTSGTTSGTLTLGRVAYGGDIAPGSGGATYSASPIASANPFMNQAGQVMYQGTMTGTGVVTTSGSNNSVGLFIGTPDNANNPNSNVTLALRSNDFAGMTGLSSTIKVGATFSSPSFNDNGRYFVQNTLQGSGVVTGTGATSNSAALLSNRSGANDVVAQVGQFAPDSTGALSATDVYRSFSTLRNAVNNLNHVAYVGSLRTSGTATQSVASALFSDVNGGVSGGSIKRLAQAGGAIGNVYALNDSTTPLPEFESITYSTSATFQTVVMNGRDDLVFSANFSAGGQGYLLRDQAGTLHKVVRSGDVAIANDPNRTTPGNTTFNNVNNIALNDMGQVAMSISLSGTGIGNLSGEGFPTNSAASLWATDLQGQLLMVCRVRDTFFSDGMTGPKIIEGISGMSSTGGQDGGVIQFNNNGDLAFGLSFTDGTSGNFVVHIPAPGSAGLLALGGLVAARRRRR